MSKDGRSALPTLEKSVLWNLIIGHWTSKLINFLQDEVFNFLHGLKNKKDFSINGWIIDLNWLSIV